jgi:drug/metabolite transporter (DMT)-like permease
MIGELAASGTAAAWGAADFCGGRASRHARAPVVVAISQVSSVPLLALALLVMGVGWPGAADIGWGFLAGLSGRIGLVLLYRTLATALMSVVAPTTGVTAALVPLLAGLVTDRPPGPVALTGAGIAVLAIGLVSVSPTTLRTRVPGSIIVVALAAGAALGLFYVLLAPVSADAGLWPLVGVRAGTLLSALVLVVPAVTSLRVPGRAVRWAVAVGALDILANAFYLAAASYGVLSVVGPIASLYPVGTVLLAVLVDRERLRPLQAAALGLAALALVLTHAG